MDKMDLILDELKRVNSRLDTLEKGQAEMKADTGDLKEGQEEIRTGVNALLEWADNVSETRDFPLPKIG